MGAFLTKCDIREWRFYVCLCTLYIQYKLSGLLNLHEYLAFKKNAQPPAGLRLTLVL